MPYSWLQYNLARGGFLLSEEELSSEGDIGGCALYQIEKKGYLEAAVPASGKNRERAVQVLLADWYQTRALMRLEEKTKRYAQRGHDKVLSVPQNLYGEKVYKVEDY